MMNYRGFPWVKASRIGCSVASVSAMVMMIFFTLIWIGVLFLPIQTLTNLKSNFSVTVNEVVITQEALTSTVDVRVLFTIFEFIILFAGGYIYTLFRTIRKIMVAMEGKLGFSEEIVQLTKRVGWLLMGGWFGGLILSILFGVLMEMSGIKDSWKMNYFGGIEWLLSGILVRTLGEIFQQGLRLQQETEGLV